MKSINSKLREVNRDLVQKIKDNDTTWYLPKSNSDCAHLVKAGHSVYPVTLSERLFKGHPIHVDFVGESSKIRTLQLVVFVGDKLKFVSKKCFEVREVRYPKIVRKGWWFETIIVTEELLSFKSNSELARFNTFCTSLKDGEEVQAQFSKLRRDYLKPMQEEETSYTTSIGDMKVSPQ